MWYIAQLLGIIGMVFAFFAFQGNTKKHIALFQAASSFMFGLDYLLLFFIGENALAGCVLSFINVAKSLVCVCAVNPKNKWANINVWMPIFLVAVIVASIVTWSAWYCVLTFVGIIVLTVAYWLKSARSVRIMYLIGSPCWLTYNVMTSNWPGVATECFNLVSLTIAFIRFDLLGRKKSTGVCESTDKA